MSKDARVEPLISAYRQAFDAMVIETELRFPPGARVQARFPRTVRAVPRCGTIMALSEAPRRALAADMVYVIWDDDDLFNIKIDLLERIPDQDRTGS